MTASERSGWLQKGTLARWGFLPPGPWGFLGGPTAARRSTRPSLLTRVAFPQRRWRAKGEPAPRRGRDRSDGRTRVMTWWRPGTATPPLASSIEWTSPIYRWWATDHPRDPRTDARSRTPMSSCHTSGSVAALSGNSHQTSKRRNGNVAVASGQTTSLHPRTPQHSYDPLATNGPRTLGVGFGTPDLASASSPHR
jgi:hypothetical protein